MQTAGAEILLAADTARNNRDLSMFRDRMSPVLLLVISAGFNKIFYLCSKDNMAGGNSNLAILDCKLWEVGKLPFIYHLIKKEFSLESSSNQNTLLMGLSFQ